MAYGRPTSVRSHRRHGRRRRRVSRKVSVALVSVLVFGLLGVGYTQLLASTCSGQETVQVVASPATARHLSAFANEWLRDEPETGDGTCARVVVESAGSAEVATGLAAGWDGRTGQDPDPSGGPRIPAPDGSAAGEPPDVWVPASTAWAHKAAASDLAEPVIPELLPSIARTPAVIAMPAPMATELGWPDTELPPGEQVRWESLVEELGGDTPGNGDSPANGDAAGNGDTGADGQAGGPDWAQYGRSEWGEFRFGMGNPARDTAGLLALTAILDSNQDGETSRDELRDAFALSRLVHPELHHETTDQLLNELGQVDREGEDAALRHVSAFPALEQEVLTYNQENPEVPLAAVYPVNDTIEADHPYLILDAAWMTDRKREIAEQFLAYVRSSGPQEVLREAGFRGTDREPGADFVEQNGLQPELVALPRTVLVPESVSLAIDQWTALTRPLNVLLAFDVSRSMLQEVPGTGEIRMDRAQQATTEVVELLAGADRLGLWEFSTGLEGGADFRTLVPMGRLDDLMDDGNLRRDRVLGAIDDLDPVADTALYDTISAAYDTVLGNYDPDAVNMVVVVTDGEDDPGEQANTVSLDALLTQLRDAPADDQQVRVTTVSFGEEPDFETMQEISTVTGGRAYYSDDGFDLSEVLRAAVFSDLS